MIFPVEIVEQILPEMHCLKFHENAQVWCIDLAQCLTMELQFFQNNTNTLILLNNIHWHGTCLLFRVYLFFPIFIPLLIARRRLGYA